jgi:ankyrin repeat protein
MLTPLHLVFAGPAQDTTMHVARILIENGANVDFRDSDSWTALLVAASWDNYISIAMLFEAGADITAQSYYRESVETLSADPEILTKFWDVVLSPNLPEPT